MATPWLHRFITNTQEQKYSLIIACVATAIVGVVVAWASILFETKDNKTPLEKDLSIQVIEKPQTQSPSHNLKQPMTTETKVANKEPSGNKKQIVIGKGNFYVQVGAFKQPNLARLMLEKMKPKYKHAKVIKKSGLYAVWVGPVTTKSEASKLKKHIQRRDNIKGFITSEK